MLRYWLIFFLTFTLDVRVKASDDESEKVEVVFQEPKNCTENISYCLLKNYKYKKYYFESGSDEFSLGFDSTLVRHMPGDYTLVYGELLATTKSGFKISTPYGTIDLHPETTVLLERTKDNVRITTLFGKAVLKVLGEISGIEVLPGYTNTLSSVKDFKVQVEIPRPALIELTLQKWSTLTWKKKDDIILEFNEFKVTHREATEQLSLLSKEIAVREVESHEQKILHEERLRETQKAERMKSQNLFRNRLLFMDANP